MPNTVHEKLQPLQNVLDEREKELEKIQNLTGEELQEKQTEIEQDVSQKLKDAIPEVRANISAFIKAQENIPDDEKIKESELVLLLDEIVDEMGGEDYPSRDELMEQLGLKTTTSNSEFFNIDENYNLSKEEVRQETYDETVKGPSSLKRDILSVFHEYGKEMETVSSAEQLGDFLRTKWNSVRSLLILQYTKTETGSSNTSAFKEKQEGGMISKLLPSQSIAQNTDLEKFFDAIQEVGGDVDPDVWVNNNGELNQATMEQDVERQIQILVQSAQNENLSSYRKAVLDKDLATEEGLTKKGHELASQLLENVPENFHNTKFEKEYEAYIENTAKKGERAKEFDEWLEERPKQGGIGGIIESLSLLLAKSGLGKIFKQFFGADSWIGKLFGAEESDEEKEDDERFKGSQYKNRRAYEHSKLAEGMVSKSDIESLSWEKVKISDIPMKEDGTPNLSNLVPDDFPKVKTVLKSDKCEFAKTKGFSIADLLWLDANISVRDADTFTVKNGEEESSFGYTAEGLAEAKKCVEEVDVAKQIGEEYSDYFEEALPDEAFTSSTQSYETLQPALKSLLNLDKNEFWKGYQVTPSDMKHFLSVIGGTMGWAWTKKFRNKENTFYVEGSKFKQREGMFGGSNDEFDSVEAFFKTL